MFSTKILLQKIQNGDYDEAFKKLYSKEQSVCIAQRERYAQAILSFEQTYGECENVCIYSTPGRTEIGGNHTDHNNGIVMAAAVNLDIIAIVAKTNNDVIKVKSKGFNKEDVIELNDLSIKESEINTSASLIRGISAKIKELGGVIGGFNAYTTSDVLRGSGLSSSAAFEVIIGTILNGEYNNFSFTPVQIAQISQYAENVYFGKPSGLMDQTACSVGGAISIDFKNNENPIVESVEFDLDKYSFALCITDTKGSHANLTDEYAAIKYEMQAVANVFGKNVLREVEKSDIIKNIGKIRQEAGDRALLRALHFYEDSRRAKQMCEAVKNGDFLQFLSLILLGGHSSFEYNQNAYSIKNVKEQGVSVGLAISQDILSGKGSWRLQGGGFAGTIQAFVPKSELSVYKNAMDNIFGEGSCYVLNVRNYGAVKLDSIL